MNDSGDRITIIATEDIEVGCLIRFFGSEADFRKVLSIEEDPHVRILTLDGPPIVRASRTDNTLRVRRGGQVVERLNDCSAEAIVRRVEICGCTNTQLERGETCGQPNCPNSPGV